MINSYLSSHSVRKFHAGCGGNYFESWLNIDLEGNNRTIATLDLSKPFPISPSTFDYVYSEHFFEHLSFEGQLNFLKESFRVLKPGGKIRMATPDFDFLARLTSEEKSDFQKEYLRWNKRVFLKYLPDELATDLDIDVYVINNYFRDWGHQLIHKKSSLREILGFCGFEVLGFQEVGESTDPMLQGLEHHGTMITDTYNKYETMVIEAVKPTESKI